MSQQTVSGKSQEDSQQLTFNFHSEKDIVVQVSDRELSSDGGLIAIKEFDNGIGYTKRFIEVLHDPRHGSPKHSVSEMFHMRVYGLLAGYFDQNDHDSLRFDAIFKLVSGRDPSADPLASQPSLSRFENWVTCGDLFGLIRELRTAWVEGLEKKPARVTLDIDAVDDTVHGRQQLCMFHGFYDQFQYLPLLISHAESGQFISAWLRPGAVHAALGAEDDLDLVVKAFRERYPDVEIQLRGDCGFGLPKMYKYCEQNGISYLLGIATNATLSKKGEELMDLAKKKFEETGKPQRLFGVFQYRAGSWNRSRTVIVKAEYNALGPNQRFVVTNRPGAWINPEALYDEYAMRGDSENRNKEIKNGLGMDRLSDSRFKANFFRLLMSTVAHNLLTQMKNAIRLPDQEREPEKIPVEALAGKERVKFQNERRKLDPLGRAEPQTWRDKLIKVAVEVCTSTRRVVIRMAANWPYLELFRRISQSVLSLT